MERFGRALQRVEERLQLPEPDRSRILREMEADLVDLYRAYRERGLSEEEAEQRALRLLGASTEVANELTGLHAPLTARLLERFSTPGRRRIEQGLLVLLLLFVVAGSAAVVAGAGFLEGTPPAGAGVVLLAAAGALVAARRAFALFLHPDALGEEVRREADPVLALAAACAFGGLLAGVFLLHDALAVAEFSSPPGAAFWGRIRDAAGTATLGITLSVALGLAWLRLRRRALEIASIFEREATS